MFFLRAAGKRLRECGGLDLDDADPATQSDAKAEEYRLGAAIIALEAVIGSEYRMRAISSLDGTATFLGMPRISHVKSG